jgi:preprotein translocase subunit SecD
VDCADLSVAYNLLICQELMWENNYDNVRVIWKYMKKRNNLILIFIIVLAFFAINLSYPNYLNQGIDFVNWKFGLQIPRFWDIPFKLGLDLQGGTHLVYEADLSGIDKADYATAMNGLRDIIERRINYFGISEPLVQTQDSGNQHRLIVELAGIKNVEDAIKMIGQTPFLEFKEQRGVEDTQKILAKIDEVKKAGTENIEKVENWQLALEDPYYVSTNLTGKYLKKAEVTFDQTTGKPSISLQFNDEGAKLFEDLTAKNVGKQLAIYVDNVALSAPVVQEKISGGKAQITGTFTVDEAKKLVTNLNAGALPVPIKVISQESIGPTLGAVSLQKSLWAGLIGFLAIVIYMILFYRLPGLLSSIALVVYTVLLLSLFKLVPVTLTLAGIGGFILSLGIAVDANVLIFSRFREELKTGKFFPSALEEGFRRSWPSIRDGHLATVIVAFMLFWFGTSFIKGFAFTLILGIIISLFSAIIITRSFMRFFSGKKIEGWKHIWTW